MASRNRKSDSKITTKEVLIEKMEDQEQPKVYLQDNGSIKQESLQNELGWLGKLFGGEQNSIVNIIGIVAFLLTVALCGYILYYGKIPSDSYITLLMTILGYLFGKK